ncbi:hypothetical protein ACIO3O_15795 [Streptomyces sp. NPDC087440]|uniref:hypothetical protein n=1 Tax=Streptomyces sp. NPDC087440 TaxID=3365790 RepID=UPI0038236BCA
MACPLGWFGRRARTPEPHPNTIRADTVDGAVAVAEPLGAVGERLVEVARGAFVEGFEVAALLRRVPVVGR